MPLLCVMAAIPDERRWGWHEWEYAFRRRGFYDDRDQCLGNTRYACRKCGAIKYRWDRNQMAPSLGAVLQGR